MPKHNPKIDGPLARSITLKTYERANGSMIRVAAVWASRADGIGAPIASFPAHLNAGRIPEPREAQRLCKWH